MTIQCCKCQRVRNDEGWSALPKTPQRQASHTYCPECFEECRREIELTFPQKHVAVQPITPRFIVT